MRNIINSLSIVVTVVVFVVVKMVVTIAKLLAERKVKASASFSSLRKSVEVDVIFAICYYYFLTTGCL